MATWKTYKLETHFPNGDVMYLYRTATSEKHAQKIINRHYPDARVTHIAIDERTSYKESTPY